MTISRIGFMQGRFSPIGDGRIQAFPWQTWRDEFAIARKYKFNLMEWVVEQDRLSDNPLMSNSGRIEIKRLMHENNVIIESLTCDTYIEEPFFKAAKRYSVQLLEDFKRIIGSCVDIGIDKIIVPLVDKGSLQNKNQEDALLKGMDAIMPLLKGSNTMVVFESDFSPSRLKDFIDKFKPAYFGINYDIGNSASLGYDFREEVASYGNRIKNVHIKDRKFEGTTVPLGEGDADIAGVLGALHANGYNGNYILQTARAIDGDHAGALCRYRDMVEGWLGAAGMVC